MTIEESIKTIKSMLTSPFYANEFTRTEEQAMELLVEYAEKGREGKENAENNLRM